MKNDKIRMLLVEDERTLADIIADTLGEREFDVSVAYDGAEGLRRFDACRPDVVVTDIMMPGMDGYTFAGALRRRSADVPILFLSARSAAEDVVRGFETGGNDYLRKPFAMSELVVRVRSLVGRSRAARPAAGVHYAVGRFLETDELQQACPFTLYTLPHAGKGQHVGIAKVCLYAAGSVDDLADEAEQDDGRIHFFGQPTAGYAAHGCR